MALWKLEPIGHDNPNWQLSTYKGTLIVRAGTAGEARQIASKALRNSAGKKPTDGKILINPWGYDTLTTCESFKSADRDGGGPDGILNPAEHATNG